jgi:CRISPR system Cascade subunit CasC
LKRAIRENALFEQTTQMEIGTRTKRLVEKLLGALPSEQADHESTTKIAEELITQLLSKLDNKGKTQVLIYISPEEVRMMANSIVSAWETLTGDDKARSATIGELVKGLEREFKDRTSAPDIALFGRMLASNPKLNMDAACQVAHALSTHRVSMEMDFYTAVDELNPDDTAGAGMMGFVGYDSACFYRYSRLAWKQLRSNLGNDTDLALRSVEGFLRASVAAVPTGKQNSFAAHNPPSFLLAVVREDGMGWSLANAFETPIRPRAGTGLVAPSVEQLGRYWDRLISVYGDKSIKTIAALELDPDLSLNGLATYRTDSLNQWVERVLDGLTNVQEAA